MGANQNRSGNEHDRHGHWGGKIEAKQARKNARYSAEREAVIDSLISDDPQIQSPVHTARAHPKRKRKDTKTWCKGKVGRAHEWQVVNYYENSRFPALRRNHYLGVWRCSGCQKTSWSRPKGV